MGYTTTFDGYVTVEPPLNEAEINYLNKFSNTRRMKRKLGAYYVDGSGWAGQGNDADIIDRNTPPVGQPGLWCQWQPTEFGDAIEWDGGEKFYNAEEWMAYIIDHFLKPGGLAEGGLGFEDFTFDHIVNGTIEAEGEEQGDVWKLVVTDNVVKVKRAQLVWSDED